MKFKDNLNGLADKFKLDIDGIKYADGKHLVCRKCNIPAISQEVFFPCQNDFIPVSVRCVKCGERWKLNIEPCEKCDCH